MKLLSEFLGVFMLVLTVGLNLVSQRQWDPPEQLLTQFDANLMLCSRVVPIHIFIFLYFKR